MPKRDPNTPKIDLYEDAYLYVENKKWHLRVNLPGRKQPVRSTKIPYNPDHPYNEQDARRIADALYQEIHKYYKIIASVNLKTPLNIQYCMKFFLLMKH